MFLKHLSLRMEGIPVFVKSFGCSANMADGEVLTGCLAQAGYQPVDSAEQARVVIYNTCAVKGPTEDRLITLLKRSPPDKKLVVAGCLPLINFERLQKEVSFDGVMGPAGGKKIVEVVDRVLHQEDNVIALNGAEGAKPSLDLPHVRSNPVVGIVPICYGCLGSCSYCCVNNARGHLRSYNIPEVVERVKSDLSSGVREFWITSQDTASYGRDLGVNLSDLLKALDDIPGNFKIRVGMMTPNLAQDILLELKDAFRSKKIFKFLHLPVQSGDDDVLKRMQRRYSVKEFKEVVEAFRTTFSNITLATDIICGFPGETQEAFGRTLSLMEEVKPDIVNISKFIARPRTPAEDMQDEAVPPQEIKRRSGKASNLVKKLTLKKNKQWLNWTGEVLIDEEGTIPGSWIGRNFAYKPIVVKNINYKDPLGKTLRLKVVKALSTYLEGDPAIKL
ncbi:MAG: tRNA (N(6)-L-threonylcarbamoyladenosine(37)-C(2))-methylthiotransferase [Thermoproteota archaeon]